MRRFQYALFVVFLAVLAVMITGVLTLPLYWDQVVYRDSYRDRPEQSTVITVEV